METKKYRSLAERMMKKSFAEMTERDFAKIKIGAAFAFGFPFTVIKYLWDKFDNKLLPIEAYIFAFIFATILWYLFMAFIGIRQIKKRLACR